MMNHAHIYSMPPVISPDTEGEKLCKTKTHKKVRETARSQTTPEVPIGDKVHETFIHHKQLYLFIHDWIPFQKCFRAESQNHGY